MQNRIKNDNSSYYKLKHLTCNSLRPRDTYFCHQPRPFIGSDDGLSPVRYAVLLLNGTLEPYFSAILIDVQKFSLKKMLLKMPLGKQRPFCLGIDVSINKTYPFCQDNNEIRHLSPVAPFTDMAELLSWHGYIITPITSCWMKLPIHSQTSTMQLLKFGNRYLISSHT